MKLPSPVCSRQESTLQDCRPSSLREFRRWGSKTTKVSRETYQKGKLYVYMHAHTYTERERQRLRERERDLQIFDSVN